MKRIPAILLSLIILITAFGFTANAKSVSVNAVTTAKTVTSCATLKFSRRFGANYKGAPTPPLVVEDTLIVVSGVNLYKLDAQSGKTIMSVEMCGSSLYATVSPLYTDGKIFVQLDGGMVQAFDYKTLESLWIYKDAFGGQAVCPIICDGEKLYTGFWNDETEYANYVCLSLNDEDSTIKKADWTYKALGGFYWVGCAINDNYVIFGKDDGEKKSVSDSKIIVLDKITGKEVSSVTVKGDVRSCVTYSQETDSYYASSKGGYVYKFNVDKTNGKIASLKTYTASGAITASPVVHNGRLYIGVQEGKIGKFLVLDAKSMKEIYSAEMQGYPQATVLVSTGYEESEKKTYIYSTYNSKPGGITVFEDSVGQTKAKKTDLFIPEGDMSEYCISTISVGGDGTLYYKNDSGFIFAVSKDPKAVIAEKVYAIIKSIFDMLFSLINKG